MKVGILTYHRVANDGSAMQAYCLQRLLARRLPHARIEIVDYSSRVMERTQYRLLVSRRIPFIQRHHWAKMRELRKFLSQEIPQSTAALRTDLLNRAEAFISEQEYDAIVVGSDTVWEVRAGRNVPVAPNAYYLPNVTGVKKIAFAASADPVLNTPVLQDQERRDQLLQAVGDFDFISYRDRATFELLASLGISLDRLSFLPDPTLLWDFSDIVEDVEMDEAQKPLAGVALGSNKLRTQYTELLRARGYDVINLLGPPVKGQHTLPSGYSLQQRLGLHRLLAVMVTNRFHGAIFTFKLARSPVLFVESVDKWPEPNSKGRDLFTRLGLEWMVWRNEGDVDLQEVFDSRLARWKEERPDLEARFGRLVDGSDEKLDEIDDLINADRPIESLQ